MDARTQRTVLRLLSVFLAAGAGDAIVQFAAGTTYDWRHLAAALVAAAVIGWEQWYKNSGELAAPTVGAVNQALQPGSVGQVAEPKEKPPGEIASAVSAVTAAFPPNQPPAPPSTPA